MNNGLFLMPLSSYTSRVALDLCFMIWTLSVSHVRGDSPPYVLKCFESFHKIVINEEKCPEMLTCSTCNYTLQSCSHIKHHIRTAHDWVQSLPGQPEFHCPKLVVAELLQRFYLLWEFFCAVRIWCWHVRIKKKITIWTATSERRIL